MKISEKQIMQLISIAEAALHSESFPDFSLKQVRDTLNEIIRQQSAELKEIE